MSKAGASADRKVETRQHKVLDLSALFDDYGECWEDFTDEAVLRKYIDRGDDGDGPEAASAADPTDACGQASHRHDSCDDDDASVASASAPTSARRASPRKSPVSGPARDAGALGNDANDEAPPLAPRRRITTAQKFKEIRARVKEALAIFGDVSIDEVCEQIGLVGSSKMAHAQSFFDGNNDNTTMNTFIAASLKNWADVFVKNEKEVAKGGDCSLREKEEEDEKEKEKEKEKE